MTAYRYSARALAPDYVRGGVGLALTALPLAALPTAPAVGWVLGVSAAAFGAHAARTVVRQFSAVEIDERGIAVRGPLPRRIDWADLRLLRLRYFSTRPGRGTGWMQLVVKGGGRAIRIESTLAGFKDIVSRAVDAADAAQLGLSAATLGNLELLGIELSKRWQSSDPDAGFVERQRP